MSDLDPMPWWQAIMPAGHDYCLDASDHADFALSELEEADLADDQRFTSILHPDGRREPCPATHAGWRFWLSLHGRSEPEPVIILDVEAHNAAALAEERDR